MQLNATWSKPVKLNGAKKNNLIYHFSTDNIPETFGCYIFYNLHGKSYSVLYIGQAYNIKKRVEQQMNNLRLMLGIKTNLTGTKYLIYCTIKLKQGQNRLKVLRTIENNLIKTALSNGYELLNKQGTKRNYDQIIFKGNRASEKMIGRKISIQK